MSPIYRRFTTAGGGDYYLTVRCGGAIADDGPALCGDASADTIGLSLCDGTLTWNGKLTEAAMIVAKPSCWG